MKPTTSRLPAIAIACLLAACDGVRGQDILDEPAWQSPAAEEVQATLGAWLNERQFDATTVAQVESIWNAPPIRMPVEGDELLARLVMSLALCEPRVAQLWQECSAPVMHLPLVRYDILEDPYLPDWARNNLRLYYGRWLCRERLYEEASLQLQDLTPADVVDPATLLFYQAVTYHRLLDRENGLQAIDLLTSGPQNIPQRYRSVASLLAIDLDGLEPGSLDSISRQMQDVERRLDLGRGGPRTREVQDEVIAGLDRLIEELEKQQQQQSGAAGGNVQPSAPAQDSQIMPGKGPGEVDPKSIGSQSGWGDLPPKQREQALQQIGRDFPSHYREAIEQYFRRSAQEGTDQPGPER